MKKNQKYGLEVAKAIEDYHLKNGKNKIDFSKIKGVWGGSKNI